MKLKGKVALITGGGRGIGQAIALAFAREGANMVVASRTLPEVNETVAQLKVFGTSALALKADVSQVQDVERIVESMVKEFGRIDILELRWHVWAYWTLGQERHL
jgi:gluconate 5-dehydrogenase